MAEGVGRGQGGGERKGGQSRVLKEAGKDGEKKNKRKKGNRKEEERESGESRWKKIKRRKMK